MTRKMKDSGIAWIGEIPEGWETIRIASLYSLRNTKVSDIDYPPLSVTKMGIVPQLDSAAKSNDHNNRKLVKKGDFVINSRSDRRGSSGISKYDGSVSLINTVLSPKEEMNPEYFDWLFSTTLFADEFYKWGNGIVDDLWTTNWSKMKNINVPKPSLVEQEKIADFLDNSINKINDIKNKLNQEIQKLEAYKKALITEAVTKGLDKDAPMKDSGIEWIGEIPEHWGVSKLKYIASTKIENQMYTKGQKFVGLEHIESFDGKLNGYDLDYVEVLTPIFNEGDFLFSKLRPYLAKGFIAKFKGYSSGELIRICFKKKQLNNFYRYQMLSIKYIDLINSFTYGVKMPRTSWQELKEQFLITPPYEEQIKISEHLDKKCSSIDRALDLKRRQVDVLEEYKKSLIYEYVTGKKEVVG